MRYFGSRDEFNRYKDRFTSSKKEDTSKNKSESFLDTNRQNNAPDYNDRNYWSPSKNDSNKSVGSFGGGNAGGGNSGYDKAKADYDREIDRLNREYDRRRKELEAEKRREQEAIRRKTKLAVEELNGEKNTAAGNYKDNSGRAYIDYMMAKRKLDARLNETGVEGGQRDIFTSELRDEYESGAEKLKNAYDSTIREIEADIKKVTASGDISAKKSSDAYNKKLNDIYYSNKNSIDRLTDRFLDRNENKSDTGKNSGGFNKGGFGGEGENKKTGDIVKDNYKPADYDRWVSMADFGSMSAKTAADEILKRLNGVPNVNKTEFIYDCLKKFGLSHTARETSEVRKLIYQ